MGCQNEWLVVWANYLGFLIYETVLFRGNRISSMADFVYAADV
jgi:hypothetical protein